MHQLYQAVVSITQTNFDNFL